MTEFDDGFVDPIANPDLPWIVEHDGADDPVPPAERLAEEPGWEFAGAEDHGQNGLLARELTHPIRGVADTGLDLPPGVHGLVAPGVPGISLTDYRLNPEQKGWGPHCTAKLATVLLAEARVTVDVRIAELVGLIMRANERDGYPYTAADTGAYNCRLIAGTSVWSNHAWALAIDERWKTNPFRSPLITDKPVWLRHRYNRYGFAWGGDYSGRKDAMHFEFMGGPAHALAATQLARVELGGAPPPPPPPPSAPPRLPWPFPVGHYVGDRRGPARSHGGGAAGERDFVRNVQQWLIYKGCVPGQSNWRSGWADGLFDAPQSTQAARRWHDRFYPGQQFPEQIWRDDYDRLARP